MGCYMNIIINILKENYIIILTVLIIIVIINSSLKHINSYYGCENDRVKRDINYIDNEINKLKSLCKSDEEFELVSIRIQRRYEKEKSFFDSREDKVNKIYRLLREEILKKQLEL